MDAQRWRGQLRLLAACVAVAASVSYGIHLWLDKRRRAALKQLLDMHQRLRRELDELRDHVDELGNAQRASGKSSSRGLIKLDPTRPGHTGPINVTRYRGTGKTQAEGLKSEDSGEEFFEFSEV